MKKYFKASSKSSSVECIEISKIYEKKSSKNIKFLYITAINKSFSYKYVLTFITKNSSKISTLI